MSAPKKQTWRGWHAPVSAKMIVPIQQEVDDEDQFDPPAAALIADPTFRRQLAKFITEIVCEKVEEITTLTKDGFEWNDKEYKKDREDILASDREQKKFMNAVLLKVNGMEYRVIELSRGKSVWEKIGKAATALVFLYFAFGIFMDAIRGWF